VGRARVRSEGAREWREILRAQVQDEARRAAEDDAALGKDPAKERTEKKRGRTVEALSEKWLASLEAEGKASTTLALYRHNLAKAILPKLGKRPARAITAKDVSDLYFSLRDSNPMKANRVLTTLGSMLSWAKRRHHIPENPAAGAVARQDRAQERADDRHLSEAEVSRFLAACERLRAAGGHHGRVAVGFELMLYAGLRPSDVFPKDGDGLKWSEIDLDAGLIRFETQKAGDAPAYLSGPARALLVSLDREPGDVFVFPSNRTGRAVADTRGTWEKVCELAEFDDPRPAPKALRKTLATRARAWGFTLEAVKPLLRHSERGDVTTGHYMHPTHEGNAQTSEEIATRLANLGEPAKVVTLKTKATK
jgi:integrase